MKTIIILLIFLFVSLSQRLVGQCSRETVINDYNNIYLQSSVSNTQLAWTGNYSTCLAGTISSLAQDNTLARINYFRKLVGVVPVSFDPTLNANCQQAALMMGANGYITHSPPTNWLCYTSDGATAALRSNLCWNGHSTAAVNLYLDDTDNSVGHRRWVLYSRAAVFGHGSTPICDVLWCINTTPGPIDTKDIAYPSAGFFPAPLVPTKWSFGKSGANFSSAIVSMTGPSGEEVPITVAPVVNGYGDNTLVWTPSNIIRNSIYDITYTVTIKNVGTQTITYSVTICQPTHPPQCQTGQSWSEIDCKCLALTGLEDHELNKPIVLITNPFSDILEIKVSNSNFKEYLLSIIDINGKVIESREICNESLADYMLTFSSYSWKKGIYFVILKTPQGDKSVFKVIKQ